MTAVVLARGAGQRMRAADATAELDDDQQAAAARGAKVMMPMGTGAFRRPFLDFVLGALADAGCRHVCLVVAPDHAAILEHYRNLRPSRLQIEFAVQTRPSGTAAAVLAARGRVGGGAFLVVNGDNLYPVDAVRTLVDLEGCGLVAFERRALVEGGGFPPSRVASFASVRADDAGWLTEIDEKPDPVAVAASGPRTLVSMNLWRMDAAIFDACRDVAPSSRGERELPDAVRLAIARGGQFRVLVSRGAVLDVTSRADVALVERRLAALQPPRL